MTMNVVVLMIVDVERMQFPIRVMIFFLYKYLSDCCKFVNLIVKYLSVHIKKILYSFKI